MSWIIVKQLNKKKSNIGQIIGLNVLWLSITFFSINIFFLISAKGENISFYIPPPTELSFLISAIVMPSLLIFIANAAKNIKINPIYINIVFVTYFLISTRFATK